MTHSSPEAIVASLTGKQRSIVVDGPTSFAEADALPEGLFDEDLVWDRETGDETFFWRETELGHAVRELLSVQDPDRSGII